MQRLQAHDAVLLPEQRRLLRAQAGDLEQRRQSGRNLRQQFGMQFNTPVFEILMHLLQRALADAGHLGQLARFGHGRDVAGHVLEGAGRAAVGVHAEALLAGYFEQVADFVEQFGELFVVGGCMGAIIGAARRIDKFPRRCAVANGCSAKVPFCCLFLARQGDPMPTDLPDAGFVYLGLR